MVVRSDIVARLALTARCRAYLGGVPWSVCCWTLWCHYLLGEERAHQRALSEEVREDAVDVR